MVLPHFAKPGKTSYEFSTSNPMWRATFDVIDFMPLVTVDYSGGMISQIGIQIRTQVMIH